MIHSNTMQHLLKLEIDLNYTVPHAISLPLSHHYFLASSTFWISLYGNNLRKGNLCFVIVFSSLNARRQGHAASLLSTMATHTNGLHSITDVDYRIIGLSPQYWTHTPLLIGDLVSLPLINGVDCFVAASCTSHDPLNCKLLPLSKVILQGVITAIDRRPNGCVLLVLDDGTGFIDVRYWDDSYNNDVTDDLIGLKQQTNLSVGDYCEVLGKIKTMTAGTKSHCNISGLIDEDAPLDVRIDCIREVHASSVCSRNISSNGEVIHWLKCLNFTKNVHQNKVKNGKDVLPLLNANIVSSILSTENTALESESNNILERKCCQTPRRFRESLLYCHCEASLVTLDPSFRYRDALLNLLLDMEAEFQHWHDSANKSLMEDCIDLIGGGIEGTPPPLLFSFQSIYKNEFLSSLARELVASTSVPEANARQLVQKTFRALTNDGLLSMFDLEADVYLFLSIERVIGPYLQKSSDTMPVAPPFFFRSVPKKRMHQVRNWFARISER